LKPEVLMDRLAQTTGQQYPEGSVQVHALEHLFRPAPEIKD
jgi:hypothetical protein